MLRFWTDEWDRVPHARGGGPLYVRNGHATDPCSPRAWGWTVFVEKYGPEPAVFPTRVGVDRRDERRGVAALSVPHARGGGPMSHGSLIGLPSCSPRAWGWTGLPPSWPRQIPVFPTRVGVDRR